MIYFVRHGSTDWNLNKDENGNISPKCQGWADIPINEIGKLQASTIKNELKGNNFDLVFCSPLTRAKQTCEIITNKKYIIDDRLIERNFGEFEGLMRHEFDFNAFLKPENDDKWQKAEPLKHFIKRVFDFFDEIKKYKDKNILIVSHGAVGIIAMAYFYGYPENNDFSKYEFKNGSYKIFDYDSLKFEK